QPLACQPPESATGGRSHAVESVVYTAPMASRPPGFQGSLVSRLVHALKAPCDWNWHSLNCTTRCFGATGFDTDVSSPTLGSQDHHTPLYITPRLGNDQKELEQKGLWGDVGGPLGVDGQAGSTMALRHALGPPLEGCTEIPQNKWTGSSRLHYGL